MGGKGAIPAFMGLVVMELQPHTIIMLYGGFYYEQHGAARGPL